MRKVAFCIHDLKLSDGIKIVDTVRNVREIFNILPITIHLIMDNDLEENDEVFQYLKKEVGSGQLEVVFHGVSHQCPVGTAKYLSWYHKYQAEFLGNSFNSDTNRHRYNKLNEILQIKTGICPPCWIASRKGWKFIKSLSPDYFEKLLSINYTRKRNFSLSISLGSDKKEELFILKILASLISITAIFIKHKRLRFIIHTIDLPVIDSIYFFRRKYSTLISKGFTPFLQKDIVEVL